MNLFIAVISNVHLYVGLSHGSRKQDFKNAPNHTALLSMMKNKFCTLIFESPLTNKVIISDVCFAFSKWYFSFYVNLS